MIAGEVANVKYRTLDKRFRQVKGADKILYGLDDAVGQDTIIIVEGEHCHLLCWKLLDGQSGRQPIPMITIVFKTRILYYTY